MWLLLAGMYLLRLFAIARLPLAPDEAYYWYWSQFPDWSYYDHPPLAAWIMALFTAVGGNTPLFVRLGGLLCSAAMSALLYWSCLSLFPRDRRLAAEVVLLANWTLLFAAGCLIQTPDTPLLTAWAVALLAAVKLCTTGQAAWWVLWGAALGVGLLGKYTMILFVPCQFAFLALSSRHRFWLRRWEPYGALLLALLLFSPVLFWNQAHEWISFTFQLHRGLDAPAGLSVRKLLEYLGGQAGVLTPLLFLAFVWESGRAFPSLWQQDRDRERFLLLLSWPVILLFALTSLRGNLAEANWPAPAYLAGLLLLWAGYARHGRSRPKHRWWMGAAVGLSVAASLLLHVHLFRPFLPIPPGQDISQQFHGWEELGRTVDAIVARHPHAPGYFVVSDRGTMAAEAVFYSRKARLGVDFLLPDRYTFLRDRERASLEGKNAVILLRHVNDANRQFYGSLFSHLEVVGRHEARFRGEVMPEYSAWILLGKGYLGRDLPRSGQPG